MLQRAEEEVLISSLYVDMMYEELINMANRGLSIRIIMRPGRDAKGLRERINKNVVELLTIATRGNTRTNAICHTRMIVVDSREILISTADLTRDQLYDEFNAGVWTEHPGTVQAAVEFFENMWSMSES
jgi:cardiolipin synthase